MGGGEDGEYITNIIHSKFTGPGDRMGETLDFQDTTHTLTQQTLFSECLLWYLNLQPLKCVALGEFGKTIYLQEMEDQRTVAPP